MDAETWKALIVVAAVVACWVAVDWFAQRATVRNMIWARLDNWHHTGYFEPGISPYVAFDIAYECSLSVEVVAPHVRTWLRSRGLA